jgi:hypothetical protein
MAEALMALSGQSSGRDRGMWATLWAPPDGKTKLCGRPQNGMR